MTFNSARRGNYRLNASWLFIGPTDGRRQISPTHCSKRLVNSHSLVTAWDGQKLVGLGNAISDGYLVVYYPHLLVLPEYRGRGIGTRLMHMLVARYDGFHQHALLADGRAIQFYRKCGFERAGQTEPMWIYAGHDH